MSPTDETSFDPSTRRLCLDDACTGVLDDGGWCAECRRSWVNAPSVAALSQLASEPETAAEASIEAAASNDTEAFSASRKLCPDGECTGLVGANGLCGECGREAV